MDYFIVVGLQLIQPPPVDTLGILHAPEPFERLMVAVDPELLVSQEMLMLAQDVYDGSQLPFGGCIVFLPRCRLPSTSCNEPPLSMLHLLKDSSKCHAGEVRPHLEHLSIIIRISTDWFFSKQFLEVFKLLLQLLIPLQLLLFLLSIHLVCQGRKLWDEASIIPDHTKETREFLD